MCTSPIPGPATPKHQKSCRFEAAFHGPGLPRGPGTKPPDPPASVTPSPPVPVLRDHMTVWLSRQTSLLALALAGCDGSDRLRVPTETGAPADTVNSGSHADSHGDSDADSHGDSGADSDTDSDTDSAADSDTGERVDADGDGYTIAEGDCDDTDPSRNPGERDNCDEIDDDCDGLIDENALNSFTYYADLDGDGYGDPGTTTEACTVPVGFVSGATDCDDGDPAIHPDGTEVCDNGIDDDCDGGDRVCGANERSLSTADAEFTGEAESDYAGGSVAGAGDVDADGFADFLIGAGGQDGGGSDAGAAYLVRGGPAVASGSLSSSAATFTGAAGDGVGGELAGVGDVDGDGYGDLLIGSNENDDAGEHAGSVWLLLGAPAMASGSVATAGVAFTGESAEDHAGEVAGAGDVNGDGYADMLVGAWYNAEGGYDAGAAYLVLGQASLAGGSLSDADAQFTGKAASDCAGAVAGAGDMNGDGFDDVLVGAAGNGDAGYGAGAVFVVLGRASPASASLASADAQLTGEAPGDYAGGQINGAGDVNADGYDDILVGAPWNSDAAYLAGAVYLVLGGPSPGSASLSDADAEFSGSAAEDYVGKLAGAGDVDGDGFADMLIGASSNDDGGHAAGAAWWVYGGSAPVSVSLAAADAQFTGEAALDGAGTSVAGPGDVDGDGYADMLVGAAWNDDGGSAAGAGYLLLGEGR